MTNFNYPNQNWMAYISCASTNVNLERIASIQALSGYENRDYVLRTLDLLEKYRDSLTAYEYALIQRTLQWSEVSKCGSRAKREEWEQSIEVDLRIHNEASSRIYKQEVSDREEDDFDKIVEILIETHGLLGQAIRGEVNVSDSRKLRDLLNYMPAEKARKVILILNECIVSAVDVKIWERIKKEIERLTDQILSDVPFEYPLSERLLNLLPQLDGNEEAIELMKFYSQYQLWYLPPTFRDLAADDVINILTNIRERMEHRYDDARHIMFQSLMNTLYYDYKGKKKLNIYKLRIIQHCLKNGGQTDHCSIYVKQSNASTVETGFAFSPVCESLIDFCVDAENSGILTYEKSITLLFDTFGFRLDQFDRLNNEESYLTTMNDTETSTKDEIINYVVGNSIVDVGSGGGVLLNKLEAKYPDARVVGTDISISVIDQLNAQKKKDSRKWSVLKHNFVDGPLQEKVDNIIFSSILHEIYSYTELGGHKFNIDSVHLALQNAYDSLNSGGRVIIRDGVKTDSTEKLTITFKDEKGYKFFLNYVSDFKGPLDHSYTMSQDSATNLFSVTGDINFMREFLYTYTWGQESYAHEVQEQFGYFTLPEYRRALESIGFTILEAREFLEEGYRTHLSDKVSLDREYPNSNCIIVAEK